MAPTSMTELEQAIEALVDRSSVTDVLNSLQGVCGLKAWHIRENWQDETTARTWGKAASAVGAAWGRVRKLGV